jgi:cytochrome c oxidase assembly protein subunit 19
MVEYLACLKRVRGTNDHECRMIAKEYLKCRMERQLMARDELANLGFQEEVEKKKAEVERKQAEPTAGDRLAELRAENQRLLEERKRREQEGGR